ncbi:MAG: LTA synthase family protein [Marinicella pacifica]
MNKYNNIKPAILITIKLFAIIGYCFALFWLTSLIIESLTILQPISRARLALYFEPIIIVILFLVLAVLTKRVLLSLLMVTGIYILFMIINAEMMRVFGLVFTPIDLKHSLQLFISPEVWTDYWKELIFLGFIILLFTLISIKTKPNKWIYQYRFYLFAPLLVIVVLISTNRNKVAEAIDGAFPIAGKVRPINLSERNGYLFAFVYRILSYQTMAQPQNYNQNEIHKIIAKYDRPNQIKPHIKPDVIIFFIEAFADPLQTGIKTSYDPIPNFRKYASESLSGLVSSPELGGRSANPEFELLTGLSMRFFPEKSIPYIDYLNRDIPSLITEYKSQGYTSHAIHVASLAFFNYRKAYQVLGFDHFYTLFGSENVEKDARNLYPSDNALVNEIIEVTENNASPQFIFSFPNATHSHWKYDAFNNSDLDVLGQYSDSGKQQLKTYINALHVTDKAIGKLIQHFKNSPKPTVVLVLGDHQPSLSEFRQSWAIDYFKKTPPKKAFENKSQINNEFSLRLKNNDLYNPLLIDAYFKSHQVPYFIWNNFDNEPGKQNTSMNLLAAPLLTLSQTNKSPLYNLIEEIYLKIKELHKKSVIKEEHNQLLHDYELLQYDIIMGQQFYKQYMTQK